MNTKILDEQLGRTNNPQEHKQQEDPQCPQTKLCLWQDDQFEELETDYLNQVFPEKLNKNTMSKGIQFIFHFLSSSLYYWIQLRQTQKPEQDKLSTKDSKFIGELFKQQNIDNSIAFNRWGLYFNKKDAYEQNAAKQKNFKVPTGQKIHQYKRNDQTFEIIRYTGNNKQLVDYRERFEVLFLFYIDGVSYVFEQQQQWVYFIIYRIDADRRHFVGVLSKYDFRISSLKERHRISQALILPTYQKYGHGKQLMDIVYKQSLDMQQCFEVTTEAPSFEFQCLRDYKQCQMVLKGNIFDLKGLLKIKNSQQLQQNRSYLLNKPNIRQIKQQFKLPGHQIQRIVNILLYYNILQNDSEEARAVYQQQLRQKIIFNRSAFKSRKKMPHITMYQQVLDMKSFIIEKQKQDFLRNQVQIQQLLSETLNGFRRTIQKLKKCKLV